MNDEIRALLIQAAKEAARVAIKEHIASQGDKVILSPVTTSTPEESKNGRTLRGAREAANFLRISTATFQQLKKEGKIKPTYRKRSLFRLSD